MAPDSLPKELIETVLKAGRCAPSGGNNQTTHLIVITRQDVLDELSSLVEAEFAKMEADENTYKSLRHSIEASKKGGYVFHYHAPVLIVTANRADYGNALADSACVLENMMIAANALNLGSCWINQLHWLSNHPAVRNYMEKLGLHKDEDITGGLILGYGIFGAPVRGTVKRNGNPVTWVEWGDGL